MAIAANASNNQTRQIVAQAMPQLHYLSDYKLQPCIEGTKEKVYHEVYLGMNGGFQIHVPRNFWHSRTQNYDWALSSKSVDNQAFGIIIFKIIILEFLIITLE